MFDRVWRLLKEQDTFAAIEIVCRLADPREAMDTFAEAVRRCYYEQRDLAATVAMGRAGIQYGLMRAVALDEEDSALAYHLRSRAKALAYNVGASTWPGWGEEGITVTAGDLAVGLDAARTNMRLARELEKGALPLSRAHWLLGAHLLANGNLAAADEQFGLAVEEAVRAGEVGDEHLNRGYHFLVVLLANPDDPAAAAGLGAAKEALAPLEYGDFFIGQLDTALQIFRERFLRERI